MVRACALGRHARRGADRLNGRAGIGRRRRRTALRRSGAIKRSRSTDGEHVDDVSQWDSAKVRLLAQIPAAEALLRIAFLDDDHVVVAGQSGHVEVIDVSGPQRSAGEVIRLVGGSPRWRVANGRVVERQ